MFYTFLDGCIMYVYVCVCTILKYELKLRVKNNMIKNNVLNFTIICQDKFKSFNDQT